MCVQSTNTINEWQWEKKKIHHSWLNSNECDLRLLLFKAYIGKCREGGGLEDLWKLDYKLKWKIYNSFYIQTFFFFFFLLWLFYWLYMILIVYLFVCLFVMQIITDQLKAADEDTKITNDWKFAAMVIDRMCLIIFTLFTIIATITVLFSAPHIIVTWLINDKIKLQEKKIIIIINHVQL